MRRRIATVIVGAVVALAASASPAAADPPAAQHIKECGQTVTSPMAVFDRSLTCDLGFAITFSEEPGAISSSTIDLRGHRFRGAGAGTAFAVTGERGLGVAGLSLTNGRGRPLVGGRPLRDRADPPRRCPGRSTTPLPSTASPLRAR